MVAEFFSKRFLLLVCNNSVLFFTVFILYSFTECCIFDGTKLNYLFDQVKKWVVLQESRLEMKEKLLTSWHSLTSTMLWVRYPSRREPFSVFFLESDR